MRRKPFLMRVATLLVSILLALPLAAPAEQGDEAPQKRLSQEELAQMLAPIALFPDELVSQILMGSTYPLEIVQADRWARKNKQSAGDVLAKQLEQEPWDPSVKSLVAFPNVLAAMSEKLELTTAIGDAFLSQRKDVMAAIQMLRKKALDAGNLKSTKEQKVVVEQEVIVIRAADPQVIYVPSYSTTVVYGPWPYPAYPPYYYYPPPPPAYPPYYFASGVAVGVAWGYAWGSCNWHGGDVHVDHNQNININNNIDRGKYKDRAGAGDKGGWRHDPAHRKNVAYRDGATARQYGQSPARSAEGRGDSRGYGSGGDRGAAPSAGTMDRGAGAGRAEARPAAGVADRGGRDTAFNGGDGGRAERAASDRGMASRQGGGGGFGGGRGGGGFGGGRGGGGRGGGRR